MSSAVTTPETSPQRRSERRRTGSINYDESHTKHSSSESDDDEDEDDAEDEEEPDAEDDDDYSAHPRKRPRKKQKKAPAQKKQKKTIPDNIDKLDDFEENYIFQALSSEETAIGEIATGWLEDFNSEENKFVALKDLINFVLRSVGCVSQLSEHDVTNVDSSLDTVAEIQQLFAKQRFHEYPFLMSSNSKNPNWKAFRKNALEFVSQILLIANENGTLYDNEDLIELLLTWLGSISTANVRSLRYVSTILCLEIETTFCQIIVKLSKFSEKTKRQLKTEEISLASSKKGRKKATKKQTKAIEKRIEQLTENLESYQNQKTFLESFLKDVFNTVFGRRYRDTDPQLRKECIHYLSVWIDEYPEFFLDAVYVRYFGWLLTDSVASVRAEVFKNLLKLYQKRNTMAALRQFTSHFKSKMIEIAVFETDHTVRHTALSLLTQITKKGFLEDDEIAMISGLIFVDSEDALYIAGIKQNPLKIRREIAKFIAVVEAEKYGESLENNSSAFDDLEEASSLDLKEMVKFRCLIDLLDDSYQYYVENYASAEKKTKLDSSKFRKFSSVAQVLYQQPRYNKKHESLDFLAEFILFDISSIDGLDSQVKQLIELSNRQQVFLLNFLYGAALNYTQGEYTKMKPIVRKANLENVDGEVEEHIDATSYLTKLISKMAKLYEANSKNQESLSVFMLLFNELLSSGTFASTNQEAVLEKIAPFVIKSFSESNLEVSSIKTQDAVYFDSLNYQFYQFFEHLITESAEVNMKLDESVKEIEKKLHADLTDTDISVLASNINKS
ncbi:unnamed protein product [Ambrosiozyma monospora]|uniref:Unnamed protein product n=1 Tax=Ambrosiozyma monospora TaxID=43982 RepID=A0ACB5SV27_AMBMO|nr:unnamed protein product [Ambrosiozyma monospora]